MKYAYICMAILLSTVNLYCQSIQELMHEIDKAVQNDQYTLAVDLIEKGKSTWPQDPKIPLKAGDVYMEQDLHHLAYLEYKGADKLKPQDPKILYKISNAQGFLGRDTDAVKTLEQVLQLEDDQDRRIKVIGDLGWMYLKTYRLEDGVKLMESVLKEDFHRGWALTLGNLYAGLYQTEKARYWFTRSIEDALQNGEEYFASIAYYNFSLLEMSVYEYENAKRYADRSLELRSSSDGFIITGEINFTAWKLAETLNSYQMAESMDDTPLSRLEMARFYRRIGQLDQAILFAEKIKTSTDTSWMYYYGINTMRLNMSLSRILAKAWKGKARALFKSPMKNVIEHIKRPFLALTWYARGMFNEIRFRALSRTYAKELAEQKNHLDSEWYSFQAMHGYKSVALRHLQKAAALEQSISQNSIPWYMLEEGIERKKVELINQAIGQLKPQEGDPTERGLRNIALLDKQHKALRALYAINPGGLRQYGLTLPIHLNVTGPGAAGIKRRVRRIIKSAGHKVLRQPKPQGSTLTISIRKNEIHWYMASPNGQTVAQAKSASTKKKSKLADILKGLLDRFYSTAL